MVRAATGTFGAASSNARAARRFEGSEFTAPRASPFWVDDRGNATRLNLGAHFSDSFSRLCAVASFN